MKIDFSKPIIGFDGQPMKEATEPNGQAKPVTLKTVCTNALMATKPKDSGAEKLRKFKLAMDIQGNGETDLKAEDIALMKDLIGEFFGPLVVGRSYELLEKEK